MKEKKPEEAEQSSSSNELVLPFSIILAALIVSASVLFVGGNMAAASQSLSGQLVALNNGSQGANNAPTGAQAAPTNPTNPTQPTQPTVTNADFQSIPTYRWEGSSTAKVTVVLFSDFQCPYCERFYTDSYKQLKTDYIDTGKVRFGFANFPLPGHTNARPAANAAECAGEQGKYFAYHDKLFENQATLSDTLYKQLATQLGLNATQFNTCYDSKKYDTAIGAEMTLGSRVGVSGTPTIYVDGQQIVGAQPYSTFKAAIDAELAK